MDTEPHQSDAGAAEEEFRDVLAASASRLGLSIDPAQERSLYEHYTLMIETNRRMNLTRLTRPAEAAWRLYADSLAVLSWARQSGNEARIRTVLDVGTGAGFPAVPLAVATPRWRITALEATGKKAAFVEQAASRIRADNLRVVHAHASHWKAPRRFDLVTFKAIGTIDDCLRTAAPLTRRQGHVLIFKTISTPNTEIEAGRRAADELGFMVRPAFTYQLGDVTSQFHLIVFQSE